MAADPANAQDRLLAAARTLGLPVPEGLDRAPLGDVTDAVRRLALARIDVLDGDVSSLERERSLLAATVSDMPSSDA